MIVIRAQDLGKHYRIGHRDGPAYRTLRETLASAGAAAWRRLLHPLPRRPAVEPGEVGEFWALRDVSFEVEEGERVGIIGRNGAGKSTLLKLLSRITEPSRGAVGLKGRVASLLEVGTGFHPELTGRENIYLNGAVLGMTRNEIRSKFEEIVAFAEIEPFLDTPVKRYSSGMYVRLAFAVAAHLEPEILVVDEVLAVGDAEFQRKCIGKMGEVSRSGRTILFVSHNMTAVQSLCNRSIWIERGRIVDDGASEAVVHKYQKSTAGARGVGAEGAFFDTRAARRRNTIGQPVLESVRVFDASGEPSVAIPMGEGMVLELALRSLDRYRNLAISAIFKSVTGQWLATHSTEMVGMDLNGLVRERNTARFLLPAVPFTPGEYSIDISVARRGVGRIDYVENAATVIVTENDVYGTGFHLTSYYGVSYLKGQWEVQ
ncbi:MAG: ABC transporter ATP-binding protein [Deferrisomatales bacterium]